MENLLSSNVKKQFRNLKKLTEELQVQMALGKAEAKDLLEQERKNLSTYLKKQREQVSEVSAGNASSSNEVLSSLENLDKLLYREVPVTESGYDAYKNSILKSIYEVEDQLRSATQEHDRSVQDNLDVFKTKMDGYRVNLALHDVDNPAKVQNIKRDFVNKLEKVIAVLNEEKVSNDKMERFSKDISDSFNSLKKAISDLSS